MNGFPGGPPPRLALSLGDSLAGMFAAQGALAALYRRTVTGEGQVVDAALTESCLAVQESTIPDYDVGGVVRGPSGTRLEGIAPSNIYPHRRRQLGGDRRQPGHRVPPAVRGDGPARARRPTTGSSITLPAAAIRTSWTRSSATGRPSGSPPTSSPRCREAGVISGPINTVAEVVEDPQLLARGMIADHWDERIERNVKGPGVVPVLSETPGTIRNAGSARPGQHNDEVYRGLLGHSAERARRTADGGRAVTELTDTRRPFARSACATACRSRSRFRCPPSSNCSTPWSPPGCARWRPPRSSHRRRCPRWPTPPNSPPNCTTLPRHRVLRAGRQPQRRQAGHRRGPELDRVRGVGRRRAQPRQRRALAPPRPPRRSPRSSRSPTTAAPPSR